MRWEKRLEADENLKISACKMHYPNRFLARSVGKPNPMYYELFRRRWKPSNLLNNAFFETTNSDWIKFFGYFLFFSGLFSVININEYFLIFYGTVRYGNGISSTGTVRYGTWNLVPLPSLFSTMLNKSDCSYETCVKFMVTFMVNFYLTIPN